MVVTVAYLRKWWERGGGGVERAGVLREIVRFVVCQEVVVLLKGVTVLVLPLLSCLDRSIGRG